jgi:hypothetical protein|tara:strand:- start:525 stop:806 length:282 start_codon:yes stop_codon:yes gene_type:complete
MATHNYTTHAGNSVISISEPAGNFTAITAANVDGGMRPYDDISVMVNGKDINVGATLAELDMYKTVFTQAFKELGIDINEIVDKKKFLDRLSS